MPYRVKFGEYAKRFGLETYSRRQADFQALRAANRFGKAEVVDDKGRVSLTILKEV